jgi:hypothetical protein
MNDFALRYPPSAMKLAPFYEASLRALRFVDAKAPTKRRFGEEADATWRGFRGHLTAADRLDLLLRDADVEFKGAFGARVAFALRGVAEDDAFGPEWRPLHPPDADALWRTVLSEPVPRDVVSILQACARAWDLTISPIDVPIPRPAEHLLVVGPSAIVSTAARFEGQTNLSWADQVICLATPAGHRHLAALAGGVLRSPKASAILQVGEELGKRTFDRVVSSDDADPADLAHRDALTR